MEPEIIINGIRLTEAQATTLRMATIFFVTDLEETGLGDDTLGKLISKLYLDRLTEITNIMSKID
jgi:hypothetical protein